MGEYFRSQQMTLLQLVIPFDVAHETVEELGNLGVVQFKDMNPGLTAPQRAFVNDVKRIDEMERKLRYFHAQVSKFASKYNHSDLLEMLMPLGDEQPRGGNQIPIPELESEFEEIERAVGELNQGEDGLKRMMAETQEKRLVLEIVQRFFDESGRQQQEAPLLAGGGGGYGGYGGSSLSTIVGSIPRVRAAFFERVLWRVTRGNIFYKMDDIELPIHDPNSDDVIEKNAFLIMTQSSIAEEKIRKLCEAFGANTFDCPESPDAQKREIASLRDKGNEFQLVLTENTKGCAKMFQKIASEYNGWRCRVLKEKAIYHTMNLFQYNLGGKALIAEGWCPSSELDRVSLATQNATNRSRSALPVVVKPVLKTNEAPPTYFKTNKFTWAHQEIVDAYGVARYQEINPTVFSIITFPFLFGVMFGDVGHGILMLLFVSFLIYKEEEFTRNQLNEMVQTCFDGRYIILLMSLFAIYTGLLYNECFSIPIAFGGFPGGETTGSAWEFQNGTLIMKLNENDYRYPFGVDPAWKGCDNELYYYNSLKMKMSVLMGVTQMMLGIILSGFNAVYRRKVYDFLFEFVPQLLFMTAIFGYLCILIIVKWLLQWDNVLQNDPDSIGREVPSLLNTLVNMFLSPQSVNGKYEIDRIWSSQQLVQISLLLLALACVPLMLLPKPFLLKRDHEKKGKGYAPLEEGHVQGGVQEDEEEEFEFQEVFIHQIIHTIEYVLGAISNTASYLRLWALSLAHSELSTVFWEKIMIAVLKMGNPISMFIGFGAWAGLSFAVLMVMESLSAFLHALRLHWVEFQSKFYGGDGYKFIPFSFERILAGGEE
mmetsp:Transcript_32672/g.44870  ORF Transcript_32672/g.44870 Transcript_32672/m.44870 type:complete len:823 (-) Transcript_32672:113-2581(-)|eukprot:CAMPEP_0201485570 /NCGR_PEP_ID=MMETSP0151_2-20130828/9641_1 /ASSEMBLY_ACC=CAM_ASM_000257 /TAXON_ID=200890 /ORGANISM="Paramoeba atlantica, Strain 621/1 / CCAP 1560/9" /LENGTH=822 /DNA_ID=CAMNT_0047869757 /DNA_START=70 /DNA_END=2538 /DNA_ORIENTATION=-